MNVTINQFRIISLIEGASYLLLVFIGMPLKYGFAIREINQVLGMVHGILTIIFCIALGIIWLQKKLSKQWCLAFFVASLIPFGAFVIEHRIKISKTDK